jgi:hypothetical protein
MLIIVKDTGGGGELLSDKCASFFVLSAKVLRDLVIGVLTKNRMTLIFVM